MEFIKAEEFLGQPVEVQRIFNDWWAPEENDLYFDEADKTVVECFNYECEGIYYSHRNNMSYREEMNPLLAEGQLRQFIEDKTKFPIQQIKEDWGGTYNIITAYDSVTDGKDYRRFEINETNLLQAYWKVAIEIAKSR